MKQHGRVVAVMVAVALALGGFVWWNASDSGNDASRPPVGAHGPVGATLTISGGVNDNCTSNVYGAVSSFITGAPNGSVLAFGTNKCYRVDDGALGIANKQNLTIDLNGSEIRDTTVDPPARPGTSDHSGGFKINNSSGITIQDGSITVRDGLASQYYPIHAFEHGIELIGSVNNTTLNNLTIDNVHGDCLYISSGNTDTSATNIDCRSAGRQGAGIVRGENILLSNFDLVNVKRSGFDFEPNADEHTIRNVTIQNSDISVNNLPFTSQGRNATLEDITIQNNHVTKGKGFVWGHQTSPGDDQCRNRTDKRKRWHIVNNTIEAGVGQYGGAGIVLCGVQGFEIDSNTFNGSCSGCAGSDPIQLEATSGGKVRHNAMPNSPQAYRAIVPLGGTIECDNVIKTGNTGGSCGSAVDPPTAPSIGTATAGNGSASVTFSPPASNGGSAITSYKVTSTPGSIVKTGVSSPITVTGLTNGIAYTFKVQATNSAGTGAQSTASNSVTPTGGSTPPGAPTSVSAVAGDASAAVTWNAPGSDGGAAINAYVVYRGTGTANPVTYTDGAATGAYVPNLTNGTAYTFTVRAQNSVGLGPASGVSNSVTPNGSVTPTVPDAPTIGTATAGDASATVRWTPPADDGGAAITGYKVTSNPATTTKVASGGGVTSFNFTGLTNATAYTFTVKATNSVGDSVASGASNSVTPTTVTPTVVPCDLVDFSSAVGLNQTQVERIQDEMNRMCRAVRSVVTGSYSSSTALCDNFHVDASGVDPDSAAELEVGLRNACLGMVSLAPTTGSTTTAPSAVPHGDCDAITFTQQTGMDANRTARAQEAARNVCDAFRKVVTDDYDEVTLGDACDNATVTPPAGATTPTISAFAAAVAQAAWRQACTGSRGLSINGATSVCEGIRVHLVTGLNANEIAATQAAMRQACDATVNIDVSGYDAGAHGPVCDNIHVSSPAPDISDVSIARLQKTLRDVCRSERNLDSSTPPVSPECASIQLTPLPGQDLADYQLALDAMRQACEDALG